jgi:HEAT repeat protein
VATLGLILAAFASGAGPGRAAEGDQFDGKRLDAWVAALSDEDGLTRIRAATAVAHFGPKAKGAVPALLVIVKNRDDLAWHAAVAALGAIGPDASAAAPALAKLLEDEDASVRALAAATLGKLGRGGRSAVAAVLELLADPDKEVRRVAASALAGGLARANVAAVLAAVRDGRASAAQASEWLARLGPDDARAVPALSRALKSPEPRVRELSADGLRRIGGAAKGTLPALRPMLEDTDEAVRAAAGRAVAELERAAEVPLPVETEEDRATQDPAALSERLLEAVLGPRSLAYRVRGHAGLTFGTTREDVERVSPIAGNVRNGPWLVLKNDDRVLFSPQGRLVGVESSLDVSDVKRELEKLKRRFGPPAKGNTERFTVTGPGRKRHDVLRVTYHLAEVVAVLRVVYAESSSSANPARVTVGVLDRRWVLAELIRDLARKREALRWFRDVVGAGQPGGFRKADLPPRDDARAAAHRAEGSDGVYWFARGERPAVQAASARQSEAAPAGGWFACIGTLTEKTAEQPKGAVACVLRLPRLPGVTGGLLRSGAFHLVDRLHSALAQEAFAPQGETITAVKRPADTAKTFEWQTRDRLTVRASPDESVTIVRKP